MKKFTLALLFIAASLSTYAQKTFKADPNHSKLGFVVNHLGVTDVAGYFEKFDATVVSSKPDFSDAVVTLSADINSINTLIQMRDNHLKTPDFFDAAQFPAMTFKSTSIKKDGTNKYKVTGDLTMHGVTKPVTIDMLYRGNAKNPAANNAEVSGIQFTGVVKRSDFNIGGKFPPPMLSDEITIKADGEFGASN